MNSDKARISQLKKYAVNYPVQSSASHLAGLGINRLNKEAFERNLNIKVFGFIHDAVDIDFEVHDLFDLLDILNRRMELDIKKEFDIPVKIDVEIGHTGNQMMEFDIKERGEEKLVIEAKGSLLALKGIKTVLEKAEINYDIRIDSIKEEFISSQFLFMAKRAFSESLGTTVKIVKAEFVIYNPRN
jgi:hypothetical protein